MAAAVASFLRPFKETHMNRALVVAGLAVLAFVRRADPPMLLSVAAAEAEGRKFPNAAAPKPARKSFSTSASGTPDRACVQTSTLISSAAPRIRIGDFVVSGQIRSFVSGHSTYV